jgi:hypothetical protein
MTPIQELINDARAEFAQAAQKMRHSRKLIEAGDILGAGAALVEVDRHTEAGEALIERAAKALDVPRRWE